MVSKIREKIKKKRQRRKEKRIKKKEKKEKIKKLKKENIKVKRLPKNTRKVVNTILSEGALTQQQIIEKIQDTKPRSIRYTVRKLAKKNVLIRQANFEDMRQSLFDINPKVKNYLLREIETD